jgi:hypothetical protein
VLRGRERGGPVGILGKVVEGSGVQIKHIINRGRWYFSQPYQLFEEL